MHNKKDANTILKFIFLLFVITPPTYAKRGAGTYTRVLLTDAASAKGAVCLDGSPGAYYIRPPIEAKKPKEDLLRKNNDASSRVAKETKNNWIIFHQGGGWCHSDAVCYDRSLTDLGSSKNYPETGNQFLEDPNVFDSFPTFTVVYAMYCDGSSWTGDATDPITVNGNLVYYRGRRLLDALFDDLLERGLGEANQLLYGGCSAGCLTSYLHIDYIKSLLPSNGTTTVVGLADSMFSLQHPNFQGEDDNYLTKMMKWGYSAWNSTHSINQACLDHFGEEDAWKCLFGSVVVQHVQTPMLIANSKYDTWQSKAILNLNTEDCPATVRADDGKVELCKNVSKVAEEQEEFWMKYGDEMVEALDLVPNRHAAFVSNCPGHCTLWGESATPGSVFGNVMMDWFEEAVVHGQEEEWIAPRIIAQDGVSCKKAHAQYDTLALEMALVGIEIKEVDL